MAAEEEYVEGKESLLNVAAVQWEPLLGQNEHNRDRLIELISEAFNQGAELIVTPELSNSGFVFNTRKEAYSCAELIPGGPTTSALEDAAKKAKGYIVSGLLEKENGLIYNAAVLIGPEGYIGKYRKNHRWDIEKTFVEPGNLGLPVFELPIGRIGLQVCYDGWFPEIARIYALKGVDLICEPTNWPIAPGIITAENPLSPLVHMVQAHWNNLFMICADRVGTERGVEFLGHSCICGPVGFIKGPASLDKEEILMAEINLMDSRRKNWTPHNNPLKDRRTDLFDELLGAEGQSFLW